MTFPLRAHKTLQRRLRKLLEPLVEPLGFLVDTEYPYRPLPENEVWGADVACVQVDRDRGAEKWLQGSPELVIEVKSASNTRAELNDKARTTLAGQGSIEFWIVDPERRTIAVHTRLGATAYGPGESIAVPIGSGKLELGSIFL